MRYKIDVFRRSMLRNISCRAMLDEEIPGDLKVKLATRLMSAVAAIRLYD